MATTNNLKIYENLKLLRSQGVTRNHKDFKKKKIQHGTTSKNI